MPSIEDLMRYEHGEMSNEDAIAMFQRLIDSGVVWRLQGSYGRTARSLIELGDCTEAAA